MKGEKTNSLAKLKVKIFAIFILLLTFLMVYNFVSFLLTEIELI